ncbi:NucA/NucB deoxyribonuclease domain-containing protein [Streptomyces sp. NPDC056367]|uniref:NucA/NucB deoxyribonuclease domain-containing protein n=1 Tax=Streptomyces sp. NPDC056367 TaxID=3345797 RepID=UPI0035E07FED
MANRICSSGAGHRAHPAPRRRRVVGSPPSPGLSCDEYPFASTKEGGTTLGTFYRGWAWVPRAEQNSQGGLLISFYRTNRVLEDDPFWVKA